MPLPAARNVRSRAGPSLLRTLALAWVVFVAAFCLGAWAYATRHWPYPLMAAVESFLAGDAGEETTLVEKIKNDFGMRPARHIVDSQRDYPVPAHYPPLEGLPLKDRRLAPLMYLAPEAPRGFRLIHGTFDFRDALHGAILLDPGGSVVRIWPLSQEGLAWEHRDDVNVFPHGLAIGRDGGIVVAYDGGTSLTRYDWCGAVRWQVMGGYHHSVTLDGRGGLWAWGTPDAPREGGEHLVRVDYETGEVLESFLMDHVLPLNPDIDIFAPGQEDRPDASIWRFDRWHVNDVDPLPPALASHYPGFEVGDLLLSFRSINLVLVLDPDSRKVKWWRQGLTRRQHDPDWNRRGTITIFDNNMHRGYSRIVEIDPRSYEHRTVVPGEPYRFYTWHRGKQDPLPTGGYLIASSEQGRVFEVDPEGRIVFEFVNRYGAEGGFLAVSEALFLPADYFEELPPCES